MRAFLLSLACLTVLTVAAAVALGSLDMSAERQFSSADTRF